MTMLKVVLDTNVFISAILSRGKPRDILILAIEEKIKIVISEFVIEEISCILKQKIGLSDLRIREIIDNIRKISLEVFPQKRINIIKQNKEDNHILECAVAGQVDYLISGDKKHILPLKKFRGIKILSPAEFLAAYEKV